MFKRLRITLTIFCTVVTGIILAAMAISSMVLTERTLAQRGSATFAGDVNSILYHLSSQKVLDHTWLSQTETNSKLMIYLEDGGNPLLYSGAQNREQKEALLSLARTAALEQHDFNIGKPPQNSLKSDRVVYTIADASGNGYYAAAAVVPLQKSWVGMIVIKPMAEERAEVDTLRNLYTLLILVAIVLLFGFAWIFTGWAIRPIEESRKRQMEFVAAASHELRSPLAVIEASTAAAIDAPPERAARFHENCLQECRRMSRLIGDMLLLASADNRTWSIQCDETEPDTLLLNVAEAFEAAAAQKAIRISVTLPHETLPTCHCDAERITQVLTILLDNAVAYTGDGGKISISARRRHDQIELRVADNGVGIPDEYKEKIFSRFYRLDASRTQKEHHGLGLSIAREIVQLHKGSLHVEDVPGGGAVFVLSLPI